MDAITLLKNDHLTVEKLFKRFEKTGDGAHVERRRIVDQIIEELSIHTVIEEQVFYPVTRATIDDIDDLVLEGLEEHHIVKWVLEELEHMEPGHEHFKAKVTVLMENVRHHVKEEEDDYFPKVRAGLGRNDLNDLGDALADAKRRCCVGGSRAAALPRSALIGCQTARASSSNAAAAVSPGKASRPSS